LAGTTDEGRIMFGIISTVYDTRADRPYTLIYGPYSNRTHAFREAQRMRHEEAAYSRLNPAEVRVYAMIEDGGADLTDSDSVMLRDQRLEWYSSELQPTLPK